MDAQFLKLNINDALVEALTSMAATLPEDGVEYLGKYLLQYVERRQLQIKVQDNLKAAMSKAQEEVKQQAAISQANEDKKNKEDMRSSNLDAFVRKLSTTGKHKQETLDSVSNFLADYLAVPAAYIGFKKTAGESEQISFVSANSSQNHIVGKKIKKQAEDGEDVPPRQGVSFEAFKLPVVEEEPVDENADENAPPKPPPVPQPLVVDNVMRDQRVQFFGIPKLGSYLAVPFAYNSCDHSAGVQDSPPPVTNEEGITTVSPDPFVMNSINTQFIICADTIGAFRRFSAKDIEVVQRVGNALIERLLAIESEMFNAQLNFLKTSAASTGPISAIIATLADDESAALASATARTAELSEEQKAEIPPYSESVTRAQFISQRVILNSVSAVTLQLLEFVFPPPTSVLQLFYAIACLCGTNPAELKDAGDELSWNQIKQNFLPNTTTLMHTFDATRKKGFPSKENLVANVRAYCDANNVFDTSGYPASMSTLPLLNAWLQKNLSAREATVAFFKETKGESLESVAI